MIKLSPCIEMLFGGDFYDKIKLAADAGLKAVEFWLWSNKDIPKIKALCDQYGMTVTTMCIDSETPAVSEVFNKKRLMYREQDAKDAFFAACEESIKKANYLGVPTLIITVGNERNDITREEQHANIVIQLKHVEKLFESAGITLIVEPLNVITDHRGYYLPSGYEGFGILDEIDSPSIKLLYDIYHQQVSEGNLIANIRKNISRIGHFHVADAPGRHEPGTGEINYRNVFKAISETDYKGYVGLEYSPTKDTLETLQHVKSLL
ncbi:hydroxypyruvate isomerase [Clostridia bacterium]|nr:hydroxypyruvate isomerase [Clostridia bacterium]